jgi:hypothetical protein
MAPSSIAADAPQQAFGASNAGAGLKTTENTREEI